MGEPAATPLDEAGFARIALDWVLPFSADDEKPANEGCVDEAEAVEAPLVWETNVGCAESGRGARGDPVDVDAPGVNNVGGNVPLTSDMRCPCDGFGLAGGSLFKLFLRDNEPPPTSSHDIARSVDTLPLTLVHDRPLPEAAAEVVGICGLELDAPPIPSSSRSSCNLSVGGIIESTPSMMRLRSAAHVPFAAPAPPVDAVP